MTGVRGVGPDGKLSHKVWLRRRVEWVQVRLDGSSLVLGRLTTRRPGLRVHLVVGEPVGDVYPAAMRVRGIGRFLGLWLRLALRLRFGRPTRTTREGRDLVVRIGMARDRIRSGQLQVLLQFEHAFHPPFLEAAEGRITAWLRARRPGEGARVLRQVPGLDGVVLPSVDLRPWAGLVPEVPSRRRLLGLRPPRPGQ